MVKRGNLIKSGGRRPESGLNRELMNAVKTEIPARSIQPDVLAAHQEVRCAVRFPLALPLVVSTGRDEHAAVTLNVSASGVLFELDKALRAGQEIQFSLRMPGSILGTPQDVLVHCLGRVVRCSMSHQDQFLAAATIDEYRFGEQ